jgi:hypothetical protein
MPRGPKGENGLFGVREGSVGGQFQGLSPTFSNAW